MKTDNENIIMHFFDTFGFSNLKDFVLSTFTLKLMPLTIPFAAISGIVEVVFGLKLLTVAAFVLIMMVELISGLYLSLIIRQQKFSKKKFSRFGFKGFVWFSILFMLQQFKRQADYDDMAIIVLFEYLHTTFITYVSIEYAIGTIQNLSKIMGKEDDPFFSKLQNIFSSYFEDKHDK